MKEIEVTELRLNNLVKQGKIRSIYYDDQVGLDDGNCYPIKHISAIPLTHLVLLEYGFVKESPVRWTHGEQDTFRIPPMMLLDQFSESMFVDDKYGHIIKTLHELQNFFYAITGKELTKV